MLTRLERAKQFLPFEALNGLKEELRRREIQYIEKKELSEEKREELQETLQELSPGEHIIVTYYNNGQYNRLRGRMIYLNPLKRTLNVSKIEIPLKDIYNIDVLYWKQKKAKKKKNKIKERILWEHLTN